MPSFESTAATFFQVMESPTKHEFVGSLSPASERDAAVSRLIQARLLLRVPINSVVETGDEIIDPMGRRFLLADHDSTRDYRVHKAIRLTHNLAWTRTTSTIDPVTKLPKGSGTQSLGPIWCNFEMESREVRDSGLNVKQDSFRVITRHPLQLGDKIKDLIVRRIDTSLGVTIAEAY